MPWPGHGFWQMGTPVRYVIPTNWIFSSRPSPVDGASGSEFEVQPAPDAAYTWSLRAADGHELAVIKPLRRPGLPISWLPSPIFEIVVGGQQAATVCHRGFLRPRYEVSTPTGQLTALYGGGYSVMSSGVVRANISRQGRGRQREIVMEFADGEDPVILIAVVLAIEAIHYAIAPRPVN